MEFIVVVKCTDGTLDSRRIEVKNSNKLGKYVSAFLLNYYDKDIELVTITKVDK